MSNPGPAVDPTTLLAHTDWMRGLAQHLVHDENLADDIAQEAVSIALASGDSARTAKPWLQTVVRNLARRSFRDRSRRTRREKVAARPESLSVDDTVERAELHSQLTSWVLELDEPYRSALLLRFFDDSSPKEIAERLDVPSSTVRVWLSRGLARIRTRLDEQHGGRPAWSVMLVNTFGIERNVATSVAASAASTGAVSWWSLGGWIMTVKNWSVVAPLVLLLIGGGVALKLAIGQNSNEGDPAVASAPESDSPATPGGAPTVDAPTASTKGQENELTRDFAQVQGRVIDLDDQPVANVTLRIVAVRSGAALAHIVSGPDGSFAFSAPHEVVDVLTDDDHWALAYFKRVRIEHDLADLKIQVTQAATLCGSVAEQGTQTPIPGAEVQAYLFDRLLRTVVANDEGHFCIAGLMGVPNELKIVAIADGYVRVASIYQPSVRLEPGETREDFRVSLQRGVPITGRVVDVEGNGIEGASVHYRSQLDPHAVDVRTEDDGHFRFTLPVGPTYAFWAETETLGTEPILDVELTAGGLSIGDWVAHPSATLEGRLVDEFGDPLADSTVSAALIGTGSRRSATSDAEGRVTLSHLLPGEHRLYANVFGTALSPVSGTPVRVQPAEHRTGLELQVRVRWNDRISGQVFRTDGEPAVRESVQIQRGQDMTFTQTDREGQFTAVGLTAADYQVTIDDETRTVSAGTTNLEWKLRDPGKQRITVQVVDGRTGEPVRYFSHSISKGRTRSRAPLRNYGTGRFEVDRAADQPLKITVAAPDLGEGELTVPVSSTTDPLNLELIVHATPPVNGRVVDADGNPVSGAAIRTSSDVRSRVETHTRPDGSFEFQRSDAKTLYAFHPEYSLGKSAVSQEGPTVLVVDRLTEISGWVTMGNRPFSGKVTARFGEYSIKTQASSTGEFTLNVQPSEAIVAFDVRTESGSVEIQTVLDFSRQKHFTVRLPRLDARLEGQVLNLPDGIDSIEFVVRTPGDFTVRERWTVEEDGTFTFPDLPAGKLTVRALDLGMPSGQSQFFSLTSGANSIQVDMAPAQGSFAGQVEGRAEHETLMLILWDGEIDIDLATITMAEVARLQASASRAVRLDQQESFEVEALAPGLYTYWLLAADPKNPPQSIEDFRLKVRSKVGTVEIPQVDGELVISLPDA
ncbi:MAG: sigma-70 family RNA polymerase sigma factor [Planctomycetota bacterium]